MSRDANQIAQEHARANRNAETTTSRGMAATTATASKPKQGTFIVWRDGDFCEAPSMLIEAVSVRLDQQGVIILTSEKGTTHLLYPQPGWYCEFEPNREGE